MADSAIVASLESSYSHRGHRKLRRSRPADTGSMFVCQSGHSHTGHGGRGILSDSIRSSVAFCIGPPSGRLTPVQDDRISPGSRYGGEHKRGRIDGSQLTPFGDGLAWATRSLARPPILLEGALLPIMSKARIGAGPWLSRRTRHAQQTASAPQP